MFTLFGVGEVAKEEILNCLTIEEGELPFSFLGMLLHSRKLNNMACKGMLDNITIRLSHWANKLLSNSGRVELVRIVLV